MKCRVSVEDLAAYTEYHYSNSPLVRRRWRILQVFIIAFAFLFNLSSILEYARENSAIQTIIYSVILLGPVVVVVALFPWLIRLFTAKRSQRIYGLDDNKTMRGIKDISISSEGITERGELIETKISWGAITKVAETPNHTFVYFGSSQGVVIPRHTVVEGEYEPFIAKLKEHLNQALTMDHGK